MVSKPTFRRQRFNVLPWLSTISKHSIPSSTSKGSNQTDANAALRARVHELEDANKALRAENFHQRREHCCGSNCDRTPRDFQSHLRWSCARRVQRQSRAAPLSPRPATPSNHQVARRRSRSPEREGFAKTQCGPDDMKGFIAFGTVGDSAEAPLQLFEVHLRTAIPKFRLEAPYTAHPDPDYPHHLRITVAARLSLERSLMQWAKNTVAGYAGIKWWKCWLHPGRTSHPMWLSNLIRDLLTEEPSRGNTSATLMSRQEASVSGIATDCRLSYSRERARETATESFIAPIVNPAAAKMVGMPRKEAPCLSYSPESPALL
ncbi:hypothetical protein B0H14DRAFT_2565139 [Mycena olivaceomarginata]|nr:hypothetical protein B0H14DRAFT_2565139 [Mycena olivaceomarginata]